jgi:hypothetical protein
VFENIVLREFLDLKRDEVTGECGRLRNEKLRDFCSSSILFGCKNQEKMN